MQKKEKQKTLSTPRRSEIIIITPARLQLEDEVLRRPHGLDRRAGRLLRGHRLPGPRAPGADDPGDPGSDGAGAAGAGGPGPRGRAGAGRKRRRRRRRRGGGRSFLDDEDDSDGPGRLRLRRRHRRRLVLLLRGRVLDLPPLHPQAARGRGRLGRGDGSARGGRGLRARGGRRRGLLPLLRPSVDVPGPLPRPAARLAPRALGGRRRMAAPPPRARRVRALYAGLGIVRAAARARVLPLPVPAVRVDAPDPAVGLRAELVLRVQHLRRDHLVPAAGVAGGARGSFFLSFSSYFSSEEKNPFSLSLARARLPLPPKKIKKNARSSTTSPRTSRASSSAGRR